MKENPLKWRKFSLLSSIAAAGLFFFGCLSETWIDNTVLRMLIALTGTVALVVIRLISIPMWRCPECGKGLPRRGMMESMDDVIRCPRCRTEFYEEE